jgi:hypothetical protein
MIPGFTALSAAPPVRQAIWEDPPNDDYEGGIPGYWKFCRPVRTDTFCTGLLLWCKDVFLCQDSRRTGGPYGFEESRTPYPCGVCIGVTDPSDW